MHTRKSTKLVTFDTPFQLQGMEEIRPAGDYEVTIEEEQIGEFMYEAFRRMSTTIYLPPRAGDFGMGQTIPVEPAEFAQLMKINGHSAERS